jgi:NAD(P)-dependent dehydrogenase (short-subunit alcohol dehydrogenase family)
MNLKGMAAIVTGGASGLGGATAEALAREGARVAIVDVNADAAAAMAQRIGGISLVCDVADGDAAERAVAKAREAHGPARVLVNCAGVGTPGRIVGREGPLPLANYERVIRINLIGTFNMLRLAAVDMTTADPLEDGERGVIINTASVAAEDGQMGQAAYSASKGGIVGMTLPIARDLAGDGIRVNTILPGIFNTPLMQFAPPQVKDALAASVPFPKRLGNAPEYAQLALTMITNGYFNGEDVRLDGAIRMAPR